MAIVFYYNVVKVSIICILLIQKVRYQTLTKVFARIIANAAEEIIPTTILSNILPKKLLTKNSGIKTILYIRY
jgi:hypothetical protein